MSIARPTPQGGDYRPHYRKRDADAYMDWLEAEVLLLKKKLALIFDQSCYSDSLGVIGSGFSVCRWCGGGSGPGGNPGFSHNQGCLMDDDQLEKRVADVWELHEEAQP
jgi:hypothetical protein